MVNQGEQVVSWTTGSGQRCRFKLQVTDVYRPLMSVSRICDAGHRVVFEANGGAHPICGHRGKGAVPP